MRRELFATIIGVIALVGSVTNASASTNPTPLQYVALGDSYGAGSGVLPPDLNAPVECLRSSRNFAHVIASKVGAQLTDVTCGGADTTHFFAAQYQDAPPQLDALSKSTQLVTMTIGGNNNGVFVGTIVSCGSRPGHSVQGQVRRHVRGHHSHEDIPVPGRGAQGCAPAGAASADRHHRLPLDRAQHPGLFRQAASGTRRHSLRPSHPVDAERCRAARGSRHRNDLYRPEHGFRRSRRVQAGWHPVGRAHSPGDERRGRSPERAG